MPELVCELIVSLDGFARGQRSPACYGYFGPDFADWVETNTAVALARKLDHPFSLCYTLYHTGYLHLWFGQPEVSRERAQDMVRMANEHELQVWSAVGTCLNGIATARLGLGEQGLGLTRNGVTNYQELKTVPVFFPCLIQMEDEACGLAQRPRQGLALLEQALQRTPRGASQWIGASFWQLRGNLSLAVSLENQAEAEACFRHVLAIAREVKAPMLELRAAISLCQLWREQENAERGRQLLRDAYAKVTEGFSTPDLKQARALLVDS